MERVQEETLGEGSIRLITKATRRVDIYDWMRLLATIGVVMAHSAYIEMKTKLGVVDYILPQNLSWVYNGVVFTIYRWFIKCWRGFVLEAFFFVSGAMMAMKAVGNIDTIAFRRAKRLLVPYFATGILWMLPLKWLGGFYSKKTFHEALKVFWSGGESGHLWFLPALLWCTVIFVAILKLFSRLKIKSFIALLLACTAASILRERVCAIFGNFLLLERGLYYLPWLTLGYIWESNGRPFFTRRGSIVLFIILMIIGTIDLKWKVMPNLFVSIVGVTTIITMAQIASLFSLHLPRGVTSGLLGIYLFHDPLNYVILKVTFTTGILEKAWGCILYELSRTVGVFFLSWGISIWIDYLTSMVRHKTS